jgi:hypothetical protein
MNTTLANRIEETLITRKGQFSKAVWARDCKVKVGASPLTKCTVMTVRAGINYDNMKAVQEKRENGELPETNGGLPWGQWAIFPYVIEHKGNRYARLYPSKDINTRIAYYDNKGTLRTYEEIEHALLASEKRKDDGKTIECITVKMNDMIELY